MFLQIILCCTLVFGSGVAFSQMDSQQTLDSLYKHVFLIDCQCVEEDGVNITSVGFKMKGTQGIIATLHSFACPTAIDNITIRNAAKNDIYDLEIRECDQNNDIAIIGVKSPSSLRLATRYIEEKECGLKPFEVERLDRDKCRIFTHLSSTNEFVPNSMPLVDSDKEEITKVELGNIYNEYMNINDLNFFEFKKTPFYNLSPMLEHLGKSVHGLSGSPLYYTDDSSVVHVVGILHSGIQGDEMYKEGHTWFVQPKYLKFEDYNDSTLFKTWGYKQVHNLVAFSKLQHTVSCKKYTVLDNFEKRVDSAKVIKLFRFYNSFNKKVNIAIENIGIISEAEWEGLKNKAEIKSLRKPEDSRLKLFFLYDYIYFEDGFVTSISSDSSLIDSLAYSYKPEGQRGRRERANREFFDDFSRELLDEITDYRSSYTNALEQLRIAQDTTNSLSKRFYMAKSSLRTTTPLTVEIQSRLALIRASVKSYKEVKVKKHKEINDVLDLYSQIQSEAKRLKDSLNCKINSDVSNTFEYIDSLLDVKQLSTIKYIIDSVLTQSEHVHILERIPNDYIKTLNLKVDSLNSNLKSRSQWRNEIKRIYDGIIAANGSQNVNLGQVECEINSHGDTIQIYFYQRTGKIGGGPGSIYPISSQIDFPRGVSKTQGSETGAAASALFIAQFLGEVSNLLYTNKNPNESLNELKPSPFKLVVVGMSDGYCYRGNYSEKDEYGNILSRKKHRNEGLIDHYRVNIIDSITCEETALEKIELGISVRRNVSLRNWRCESWKECGKDKHYKNNQSFNSYKNNIRLAYHRADNFNAEIIKNIKKIQPELFYNRNNLSELWVCNVAKKEGQCRRTEVGLEINLSEFITSSLPPLRRELVQEKQRIQREFSYFLRKRTICDYPFFANN